MTPGLLARIPLLAPRRDSPRAASSRRAAARRTVVWAGLAGVAALVAMSVAIETVQPEWRDPEFGHRIKRLRTIHAAAPDRPLVLFLGTSRAQNAFDPAAMGFADEPGSPLVFNFGQSGALPVKVWLTFERIRDAGIRPSAILVETLPFWLFSDGPVEVQFENMVPRLSATDLHHLAPYSADPGSLRTKWLAARVAPWHAQRVVLMSHWLPRWQRWGERIDPQWDGMAPNGFVPYPQQFANAEFRPIATAHAHEEYGGVYAGFGIGETSRRALGDLVARCRSEGIAVAFVEPPVSPMFRSWFKPGVWVDGENHLRAFARELGVEVFPPFEGLAEADFIDGHHMLENAAEKYSRWLADTHLKPWLSHRGVGQ